jgi:hypothetical protein
MLKTKPDTPLAPEIVASTPNGTPISTKIRMGMKSSSVCTRKKPKKNAGDPKPRAYTQNAALRVMILIARLLEVAAHVLGERLNRKSLLAALLRIDSLNALERQKVIQALGPDVDVLRRFLSEEFLKVLNSEIRDPLLLEVHLKRILRGPLGFECWGDVVTESQMANAVTSNLLLMGLGLLHGPAASKGIVAWGPAGGSKKKAEPATPVEPPIEPVPSTGRSRAQPSEEISIWASLKEPSPRSAVPSKKREFAVGGTTVRFL